MQFFPSPVYPALHIHINVLPDGTHSPFVGSQSLLAHGSIARSRKKKFMKKYQIYSARNSCKFHSKLYMINIRGGSRTAATSNMKRFVIIVNGFQPYYHKALHLGCCNSLRSISEYYCSFFNSHA